MPTHHQGTPEEVLALDTFIKFQRANNAFAARLARHDTLQDLTETQFAVLEALYHLGPMCQSEIVSKLLTSGGNVTLVIDNLEKHGYVERRRTAEDRRMVRVSLTDVGRAKIVAVFPCQLAAIVQEMGALTPDEQRELGRLLKKLGTARP